MRIEQSTKSEKDAKPARFSLRAAGSAIQKSSLRPFTKRTAIFIATSYLLGITVPSLASSTDSSLFAPASSSPISSPEKAQDSQVCDPLSAPISAPVSAPISAHIHIKDDLANTFELFALTHRAGEHTTPDAVVRCPLDFDRAKPMHLVIYNHGWGSNARTCFVDNHLSEQMKAAPPNTVLIVPEWQQVAAAKNGVQGRFGTKNMFRDMLLEIFDKTPPLKNRSLADVDSIGILAHSAGYGPTETEIYENEGLADKVKCITLLDALYDKFGFDPWLESNIKDLANGKKRFQNFFSGTPIYSKAQAERVEGMLRKAKLSPSCLVLDYDSPELVMSANSIADHPIVFKFSSATSGSLGPHMSMPLLYVGLVQAARN